MDLVEGDGLAGDDAARVRVAQAWRGLSDDEMAAALGTSRRTIGRLRSGAAPLDDRRRRRITEITGVPMWFMEHGFAAAPEPDEPALDERVAALEQKFETLRSTLLTRRERP